MPPELRFTLRVPKARESALLGRTDTSFRFHGLLRIEAGGLHLEWAGIGRRVTANLFTRRSETIGIPPESLTIPPADLSALHLRGGWWLPHIELIGRHLATLAAVPSENRGLLRLWIARGDRAAATTLIAALAQSAQGPIDTFNSEE